MERKITDNIAELKRVLPYHINEKLDQLGSTDSLIEIVLDLGRQPTARFADREVVLSQHEVTREDIDTVVNNIGSFDADNRAGMERTLHRISAIRNRRNAVVGLTCRVGRAVYGTIDIIQDLIETGQSILMLGAPGVGKTTLLREAARVLADAKRVVIVDTSNEIGGDGDVPHPAVGRARRMQVARPELQHEVMIEAVENHNPEVIVIDEIGRELEATAARTIAERGVQLIGTAHGTALDNLMLNPTLSDLVGGIESVTLSDEEARRRGTQKTVLERRAPPTFDVLIEIQTRDRLVVHEDVSASVDGLLRGKPIPAELRYRDANGELHAESFVPEMRVTTGEKAAPGTIRTARDGQDGTPSRQQSGRGGNGRRRESSPDASSQNNTRPAQHDPQRILRVYAYGIARNRLQQAAKRLHVPLEVLEDFNKADAIMTLKNYYRRRPKLIVDSERRGMPIYVLRANTVSQMEGFLIDIFNLDVEPSDPFEDALREAENAVLQVRAGADYIDLAPQHEDIRRNQHQIARRAHLISRSYGQEPNRHIRIFSRNSPLAADEDE